MTRARTNADQAHTESLSVVPHIIPDVLYPAVAGNDLDGTDIDTSHGSTYTYGTTHADGRMYYYTDIKGSKPIKDPRIGGHFGSQRYTFRSAQKLEQETATHGEDVWSVDGREWIRIAGNAWGTTGSGKPVHNSNAGVRIDFYNNTTAFIEIVGYFNDANLKIYADTNSDQWNTNINGGTVQAQDVSISVSTPLSGRYVDAHSLVNLAFNSAPTLGINTLKISVSTVTYFYVNAIELIAQDTSSTANKSKIQIPSQNVVSYGKKFTVSGTPHYDPFNGFTNDTTLFSSVVDVATSLGLGTATTWGAPWDKGSDDHIRPFNGGRVVKWVDSSGTIKTSVTMMPANAQNISTTASNEITTASATNSHTINFSNDAVEHSLSEVAKTFYIKEFGNGYANGGGGASGTYKDASLLDYDNARDIAYVMDDGLTSLSGHDVFFHNSTSVGFSGYGDGDLFYFTFIGTGFSINQVRSATTPTSNYTITVDGVAVNSSQVFNGVQTYNIVQNLPYGTHIVKFSHGYSGGQAVPHFEQVTFYQPKKPPIPDDACIISDYMLMADPVMITSTMGSVGLIPKGVRRCSASRDTFVDSPSGGALALGASFSSNTMPFFAGGSSPDATDNLGHFTQPSFSTRCMVWSQSTNVGANALYVNGSSDGSATNVDNTAQTYQDAFVSTVQTLGINKYEQRKPHGGYGVMGFDHVSPTHTSSHYSEFETPYLKELTGGDRNMEQTHLVVTPDGKTWDEVTRDTSYIGNGCWTILTDTAVAAGSNVIWDHARGTHQGKAYFNKDFAIAYDRIICLVDGQYEIHVQCYADSGELKLCLNGDGNSYKIMSLYTSGSENKVLSGTVTIQLKRGDYLLVDGIFGENNEDYNQFNITRV